MSCFRVSCHPLQIERRRYHRPTAIPANERYCPFCLQRKLEMVKDEAYFMIECESYIEERCLLFDAAVAHHPSLTYLDVELQMILLLCSWNLSKIMSVSKFVRLKCNTGILVKV